MKYLTIVLLTLLMCSMLIASPTSKVDMEAKAALALAFSTVEKEKPKPVKVPEECYNQSCICGCLHVHCCPCLQPKVEKNKVCPCSLQCTCGCNESLPCRCGDVNHTKVSYMEKVFTPFYRPVPVVTPPVYYQQPQYTPQTYNYERRVVPTSFTPRMMSRRSNC